MSAANSSKCLQDQKTLLLQLRNNLTYNSEISPKLVKWNPRIDDCCKWQGVSCNGAGQVIGLDLSDESFSGSINPLANLKFLSVIRLDGNNLSVPIPEFFADFSNLTVLSLSSCNLIGEAPQKIFQVPTLQTIDLSLNDMLGGSLPEFPSKGSLQTLVLRATKFSGSLPESLGNLRKLSYVEISACNFTGPIPSSMENLTHLVHLDLHWNSLTGSFPYFKLSKNLTYINCADNKLTGISSDWEGLENLEYLDLRNNSISGLIPASLFYLPSLLDLVLSNNKLSGQITELQNVISPRLSLDLSTNKLEGPIPEFLFELHDLLGLSLSSNKFNGTVQLKKFTKINQLVSLHLSHNSLSVDTNISESDLALLPQLNSFMLASCNLKNISFLKNQSKLSMLDLSNNQLTGEIPNWLVEINDGLLRFLNLSFNQFTHLQEPYTFGYLNFLDLHSNLLTGVIPLPPSAAAYIDFSSNNFATFPPDFGNYLVTAKFLSIANNKVIGSIPSLICKSSYLEVLDLSNNSLNGIIPPCLAEKSSTLKVLNLGKNNLIGNIPENFSYDCELQSLDLSQNHLTGLLPRSLSNCTKLKVLNLGNNKITDTFP
ncbi:receptor-like protein 47 [Solanum dulcamara]|uniref:receptor-like protein 47 n=1 Tax=Solanum dulcamara TaxID=45834 RepID=UPI0024864460|nr:receptor-like protein 47 [Solanum dulcamara]